MRPRQLLAVRILTWAGILLLGAGALTIFLASPHSRSGSVRSKSIELVSTRRFPIPADGSPVSSVRAGIYSVIPGGVHSKRQLATVLARDPVVARHYANFDLAKLRFVRLGRGREAYVSYRIGDMIFWTNHKIRLFAGETLLTDGTHLARSRCGNRVSVVPRQPTSSYQPSDAALAAPILNVTPSSPELPPLTGFLAPGGVFSGGGGGDGSWGFPVVFFPPGGGGGGSGGGSSGGTPVYPPGGGTPVNVPEPGTLLLLSSGLATLGLLYLWNLWRR